MRSPSISMNRPRGGSAASTFRAVLAVNQARPVIRAASSRTNGTMIVMDVLPIFGWRFSRSWRQRSQNLPVRHRRKALDQRHYLGAVADHDTRSAVLDRADDDLASLRRRHGEHPTGQFKLLRHLGVGAAGVS